MLEQARLLRHNFRKKASIEVGAKTFVEKDLYWVDFTVFDIFTISMINGNPATALNDPNKIMLSESVSKKMFGTANPVARNIKIDDALDLEITGVYEDFSNVSTLDCGMMGSFNTLKWTSETMYWSNASYEIFLLTQEGTTSASEKYWGRV